MKNTIITVLFSSLVYAHSGVWNLDIDGISYPARDARMDGRLGAKRIEWSFSDSGRTWGPIENLNDQGLACGKDPQPPALKAIARAGAKITTQWSGIVRTHFGPTITYLAYSPEPNTKPQNLSFFKIAGAGYNAKDKLWANEELIKSDRKDTFQIPSDIKPGNYVLRTELIALHYASKTGPQFYPHCFNIEVKGDGTATPEGVKFPGAYKAKDPSLFGNLWAKSGAAAEKDWENYVVPGPPKYAGKYNAPTGPVAVLSEKERGIFPAGFQAKYEAFKKKEDAEGLAFNQKLNDAQEATQHGKPKEGAAMGAAFSAHFKAQKGFDAELKELRTEAIKLGIAQ